MFCLSQCCVVTSQFHLFTLVHHTDTRHDQAKFPKHEMLMGIIANTKLAGHTDGFRAGPAIPIEIHARNGPVASNTWTAAHAPDTGGLRF